MGCCCVAPRPATATASHTSRCGELACRQTLHTVSLPLSELPLQVGLGWNGWGSCRVAKTALSTAGFARRRRLLLARQSLWAVRGRWGRIGRECIFKSEEWHERRLFVILAAGSTVSQRRGAVETSQRGLCFFVFSSGVVRSPPVLSGVQAAGSGNGRLSAEASCFVHLLMRAA